MESGSSGSSPPAREGRFEVEAFNFASASQNRIHDDTIAGRYGFRGGLVPGVAVYSYAARAVLMALGERWLERGTLELRFVHPVYDGERVVARAVGDGKDRGAEVKVENTAATLCAQGLATLGDARARVVEPPAIEAAPLPVDLLPASCADLTPGLVMGAVDEDYGEERRGELLARYREDHPLYQRRGGPQPPALIPELANRLLSANVALGPWIHVRSAVRHLRTLSAGHLEVRGRVLRSESRRSGERVVLEVLVLNHAKEPIAVLEHEAIVRLPEPT
jgi:acyl dehydratase